MSHTPGPWRWWACKGGDYDPMSDYAQIAAGTEHVARVNLARVTEDDLRLMVSAPDLLEALQKALRDMQFLSGYSTHPNDAIKAARAAIAKATGAEK